MMSKSPRTHTAAFKAQVALAAMKGDQTLSQVAARFGVHTRLVQGWKKQMLDQAATIFSGTTQASDLKKSEEEKSELFEQIGRLKMELEWLKKKVANFG
ncbi:MAG: helix-turn-helix domain-containing protein [Zavarzinella sp.]